MPKKPSGAQYRPETAMPWFRRAQIVLLGELLKDPEVSVRELFTAVKQMSEAD